MTTARLIIVNAVSFLILKITWLIAPDTLNNVIELTALPNNWGAMVAVPWSLLSYMFLHVDFWHLLVNMLWLGCFGILLERLVSRRWLLAIYLIGGIVGGVFYLSISTIGTAATDATGLVGASAATLSIIAATAVCVPNRHLRLPIVGRVQLRWLAIAGLCIFVCASLEMSTTQFAAHLGGLIAGLCLALTFTLIARRHQWHMERLAKERIATNALLNKARRSGYASLSREERLQLFKLSNNSSSNTTQQKQ